MFDAPEKTAAPIAIAHRFVAAVCAVLIATLPTLTACRAVDSSAESDFAQSTSDPLRPQFDVLALSILDDIARGDFDAATTNFDERMRKMLSAEELCSAWDEYQRQFGRYRSHGGPARIPRGELTVVNVPLQMAKQAGELRVTFHPDTAVAGLYLLRAGVPVPGG